MFSVLITVPAGKVLSKSENSGGAFQSLRLVFPHRHNLESPPPCVCVGWGGHPLSSPSQEGQTAKRARAQLSLRIVARPLTVTAVTLI